MITVAEARARVLALASAPRAETIGLEAAYGRALLDAPPTALTNPPFDSAAMDGYALRDADLPGPLTIIGEAAAGHPWHGIPRPGTAIRIFTGAPVPAFYDRVEMQENTIRDGDRVTVINPSTERHIRPRGSDFVAGHRLAPGRRLSAADIGLLAAMNIPRVQVARRPVVAILPTGDELLQPGATPRQGQIIASNHLAIAALATQAGAQPRLLPIAGDTASDLQEGLNAAQGADLLVTIGGASVGDRDMIAKIAPDQGFKRDFHKISMRPGKPLLSGMLGTMPLLGLPGNPVSAIICGILFMQPLLRAMQGINPGPKRHRARLARALPPEGSREHYLRAILKPGEDLPRADPFERQDSALLSVLSSAEALLVRPAGDLAREAGEILDYIPLDP